MNIQPFNTRLFQFIFVLLLIPSSLVQGQNSPFTSLFEQLGSCPNDSCRQIANAEIVSKLESALKSDAQMKLSLEGVPNCGVLVSDDKKVRIFNWNMPIDTGGNKYFGFLQVYNQRLKKYIGFKLSDKSSSLAQPERGVLSPDKWFGCLYYKIIETGSGRSKVYTLLGMDLGNGFTSRKIIEVLAVNTNGVPSFGGQYFQQYIKKPQKGNKGNDPGMPKVNLPKGKRNLLKARVVMEYKTGVQVKLTYNALNKSLEVPHLAPDNPSLVGQFQFYGPDMSIDAYKWQKGKWVIYEDIDARNVK